MSPATSDPSPSSRVIPGWMILAAWAGSLLWAGTIFWFSSRSGPEIAQLNPFEFWDKAVHFAAFAAGAPTLFLAVLWSGRGGSIRRAIVVTAALLALYGAADEFHQLFTPNRMGADLYDWMADALGGLIGTLITAFIYVRTHRFTARPGFPRSREPARAPAGGNP